MNMPCSFNQQYNDHMKSIEEAEQEAELNEEQRQQEISDKLKRLYSSPDYIWEALGPDGIQYPYSIKSIANRDERLIAEANFDNDLAMQLSYGLREKDYYLIGMILGEFANEYLKMLAED